MKDKNRIYMLNGYSAQELLNSGHLLDEKEAAFCLGCSVGYLQRDRHAKGNDPDVPYIKRGKLVRYEPEVLRTIIENSRIGQLKAS